MVSILLMVCTFLKLFQTYITLVAIEETLVLPMNVVRFKVWCTLEVLLVSAIALANMVFLLVRSFKRNELDCDVYTYYEKHLHFK